MGWGILLGVQVSQLPECFQGHDLTGWVLTAPNRLSRLAMDGERIALVAYQPDTGVRFYRAFHAELSLGQDRDLGRLLFKIGDYIKGYGGWAPAPIGSDPGWQPIETYPIPPGPTFPAFTGGNSDTGFVGECYWASVGQEFQHYGGSVELTHFKPLPAPPEAKS